MKGRSSNSKLRRRRRHHRHRLSTTSTTQAPAEAPTSQLPSFASSSSSFPFPTEYNDHFETPLKAYEDIRPLLECILEEQQQRRRHRQQSNQNTVGREGPPASTASTITASISSSSSTSTSTPKSSLTLYDPYYCNGRTKALLKQLGFDNVVHEKRDFYGDIRDGTVPEYDVLVTNPPYSDIHKSKCLGFCFEQLADRGDGGKSFFVLLPDYVAAKQYYRELLKEHGFDDGGAGDRRRNDAPPAIIFYLVPDEPYEYDHPEGTGKSTSPFRSIWFCGTSVGIGGTSRSTSTAGDNIRSVWEHLALNRTTTLPRMYTSLQELEENNVVSFQRKRPNPKQRRKRKLAALEKRESSIVQDRPTTAQRAPPVPFVRPSPARRDAGADGPTTNASKQREENVSGSSGNKRSKYRDATGNRTKRRF